MSEPCNVIRVQVYAVLFKLETIITWSILIKNLGHRLGIKRVHVAETPLWWIYLCGRYTIAKDTLLWQKHIFNLKHRLEL